MAKKDTNESYLEKINTNFPKIRYGKNVQYINSSTPIKFKCLDDGYEWSASPTLVRMYGCPVCSGHVITSDIYTKRLNNVHNGNIILDDKFNGISKKAYHYCKKHNNRFLIMPYAVLKGQGCSDCRKEKLRTAALLSKEDACKKLYDLYGDEYVLDGEYMGVSFKNLFRHNMPNGTSHTFVTSFSVLFLGETCGVCSNNQVFVGYNDIATTNPYVASLFTDKKDTYKYVELSNKKVNMTCPCCNQINKRTISTVVKNNGDMSCSHCGDGISYPNKFIYNLLFQIRDDFDILEREYKPKWCSFEYKGKNKHGYYDIYIKKGSQKILIEMDGGLHKVAHSGSNLSIDDIKNIDNAKDKLAVLNGYQIIRIDCAYDNIEYRFEFIKNSLINSKLAEIVDFSKIDFESANILSLQSLLITSSDMWNDGKTVKQISDSLGLTPGTIRIYLSSAHRYGLCDYSKEKNIIRSSVTRKIILLNTGEIFDKILYAGEKYNVHPTNIQGCCSGRYKYAGVMNEIKLVWKYFDEYENMTDEEIKKYLLDAYNKKVVCLENNYLFANAKEASKILTVTASAVQKCCLGKSKSCGKSSENIPLHWMYFEEYKKKFSTITLIPCGILGA